MEYKDNIDDLTEEQKKENMLLGKIKGDSIKEDLALIEFPEGIEDPNDQSQPF